MIRSEQARHGQAIGQTVDTDDGRRAAELRASRGAKPDRPMARRGAATGALPRLSGASQVRWTPTTVLAWSVTAAISAGQVSGGVPSPAP
jgi:hypothetical protein